MKPVRDTFSLLFSRPYGLLCLFLLDLFFLGVVMLFVPVFRGFDSILFALRPRFQYWAWLTIYIVLIVVVLSVVSSVVALYKYVHLFYVRGLDHGFRWLPRSLPGFRSFLLKTLSFLVPALLMLVVTTVYLISFIRNKSATISHPVELALHFFGSSLVLILLVLSVLLMLHLIQVHWRNSFLIALRSFFPSMIVMWHDLKILFMGGVVIGLVHLFFKVFVFSSMRLYLDYYGEYKRILWFLFFVMVYSLFLFNRVFLYQNSVQEDKAKV
ncbi:MAG: hypothetical protein O2779_02145 [Nanoarchaeota archaeon]|nr:hypothetical protein [Nanoarchaeota archaeon]